MDLKWQNINWQRLQKICESISDLNYYKKLARELKND